MNMVQELRDKTLILLKEYKDNEDQYNKYLNIYNILKNNKCFFEMDADISINILYDLGYNNEEAKKIYTKLISIEEYNKWSD